jgi:molecular chaperone DnaK
MTFFAEFPTIEHEEQLKIEIKQAEPPKPNELSKKITQSKSVAKSVNRTDLVEKLNRLHQDIETIGSTPDGRLRIMDEYRQILRELEKEEKDALWPKVEEELKEAFYELEDLVEKIKRNADDGNLNMSKIESHLEEYRKKVEHILKEKNIKEAKELTIEIGQLDFELRNAVTGNAMDVQLLRHINDTFSSYHWKDANKARHLVNQGLQMAINGNTSSIRNILIQIIGLMPDNEKPTLK